MTQWTWDSVLYWTIPANVEALGIRTICAMSPHFSWEALSKFT